MKTTQPSRAHLLRPSIALLMVGLMTLCAIPASAQVSKQELTSRTWSDGFVAYTARHAAGGLILLEGIDLHEGGFRFALEPQGGDFYRLQPTPGDSDVPYSFESAVGHVVHLRTYEGHPYLTFYDDKSTPIYVMAPIRDLRETMTSDIVNYYLAGEYQTRDGRTIRFAPSGTVSGLTPDGGEVKFTWVTDNRPACAISLADGSEYCITKEEDKLNIYNDCDIDDTPLIKAHRTRFLAPDDEDERLGVYPVTARRPLTSGILSQLTPYELQVMRNEIYARRGLRFNRNGRMQEHFEQQPWYQPDTDDVTDRLTELDKLNITLIRRQEEAIKNE